MPRNLGNFPRTQAFGKFPNFLSHLGNLGNLPNTVNLENSQNSRESGKFSKFLGESKGGLFLNFGKFLKCFAIWKISQIPRHLVSHLGNFWNLKLIHPEFPKYLESGKFLGKSQVFFFQLMEFLKCLSISEISQIPSHFGNFWNLKNILPQIPRGIWEIWGIPQIPGNLGNFL